MLARVTALAVLCGIIASCSNPSTNDAAGAGPRDSGAPLKITATTGMIADAARIVGGDHVAITALMGPGVDPHLYKATQGDLDALANADLVLYNGLHLEGRMADVLVKMASRVKTVQITDAIPQELLREPPEFQGHYDPHVWFDVSLWSRAVERVRDALIEVDSANADAYRANADAYLKELMELHEYAKAQLATIPESGRVLITAHDAFGYFGQAYGLEVMGLQGISTAAEFGLQDIERLVNIVVDRKIKAVFIETSISPKSIEALIQGVKAKGHEVAMGGQLYSDALGEAGTPAGTYVGMVRHNVDTIVGALK
ncbi:MAG: ABC transporter substrate-binding protein [Candidatus Hydrogenedentota bacterium]